MKVVLILSRACPDGTIEMSKHCFGDAGCIIGRQAEHIQLEDRECSRNHAMFYCDEDGRLWLKDLESRNGTFIDGRRIETEPVYPGSRVRVGQTEFEIKEFRRHDDSRGRPLPENFMSNSDFAGTWKR